MIPKFRAWDKELNMLSNVLSIDFEDENVVVYNWKYGVSNPYPTEKFELMQSTGLKDKNGVEIFEGDIVKTNCGERGRHIGVVTFRPGKFAAKGVKQYEGYVEEINGTFEVLGNRYEHPHLLEGDNE